MKTFQTVGSTHIMIYYFNPWHRKVAELSNSFPLSHIYNKIRHAHYNKLAAHQSTKVLGYVRDLNCQSLSLIFISNPTYFALICSRNVPMKCQRSVTSESGAGGVMGATFPPTKVGLYEAYNNVSKIVNVILELTWNMLRASAAPIR